jgi:hypothetical protein
MRRLLFVLLVMALPTVASAQAPQLASGDRLRLTLHYPPRGFYRDSLPPIYLGSLVSGSTDSIRLSIHPGMAPIAVSRSALRRMERSRGKPPRIQSSLRLGGAMAAFGGTIWAVTSALEGDGGNGKKGPAITVTGTLLGLLFGALLPSERWQRLPISTPMEGAAAASDGFQVPTTPTFSDPGFPCCSEYP